MLVNLSHPDLWRINYALVHRLNFDPVFRDSPEREKLTKLVDYLNEKLKGDLTNVHTRFIFKPEGEPEEEYTFWLAKFFTCGDKILRVPYPQAPMVALETQGIQDPFREICPISFDRNNIELAVRWLRAFGAKYHFTGDVMEFDLLSKSWVRISFWPLVDKSTQLALPLDT